MPFIPYSPQRPTDSEIRERVESFYHLMDTRRSVRFFAPDPIPAEVLEHIVLTAGTAPSGAHKQPWFFAIVTDPAIKHAIREAAEAEEKLNYDQRFTDEWKEDLAPFRKDDIKPYLDIAPAIIVVFKESYRLVEGVKNEQLLCERISRNRGRNAHLRNSQCRASNAYPYTESDEVPERNSGSTQERSTDSAHASGIPIPGLCCA